MSGAGKTFGEEGNATSTSIESGFLMDLGSVFHDLGGLGKKSHDFRNRGDWLKI